MRARPRPLEQLAPAATAGELMVRKGRPPIVISSGATVLGALQLMQREDVGFLPVLDGGRLAGVLSERDIARRGMLEQRVFVRDVMTARVHAVAPETTVSDCAMLMQRERIRHVPVVSGDSVLGVLSVRDLMGSLLEQLLSLRK